MQSGTVRIAEKLGDGEARVKAMLVATADAPTHGVSFREAVGTWAKVAVLSFGGPAGQIATMHRILVEEKKWIDETRFLHALNYCMLLPGPEAQQLAVYIGVAVAQDQGRPCRRHVICVAGICLHHGLPSR